MGGYRRAAVVGTAEAAPRRLHELAKEQWLHGACRIELFIDEAENYLLNDRRRAAYSVMWRREVSDRSWRASAPRR
ncbi:MAG: DUF3305 domain-containing protein [Sterolibacteriaceae bacterium]|uniref:DUF3305 domain-containing protein n=1 Tax=Candidatus Methylophosphatis roskildensis TaxID=2899263 RepID=A0A9D7E8L3_9PROT|nr:DUF3305 domain-containing protein [Candidatus Methylophosphatis roskildensis]